MTDVGGRDFGKWLYFIVSERMFFFCIVYRYRKFEQSFDAHDTHTFILRFTYYFLSL